MLEPLYVIAAGFAGAIGVAPFLPAAAWAPLAAGALIAAVFLRSRFVLIGLGLGFLAVAVHPPGPRLDGPVVVEGVVVGAPSGSSVDVAVSRWARPGGSWTPTAGRVRLRSPEAVPALGAAVVVFGAARPLAPSVLPGAPDPLRNAGRTRIVTEVGAERWAYIEPPTPTDDPFAAARHRGLLRALVFGDRAEVSPEWTERMRDTGTTHVLSISGFHVGLVAATIVGVARWFLRRLARFRRRGFSDAPAWVLGAVVGVGYAWVAGAPTSAQRAAWMLAWVASARILGREPRPLTILGGAALLVLAWDPAAFGTASFQLSFTAMLGLIRVAPWCMKFVPPDLPRPVRWAAEATATTIGATVATLPISAWWFQQFAPSSPLANLVALPWCSFVLIPVAVAAGFAPTPLRGPLVGLADHAVDGFGALLEPFAWPLWTPAIGPLGALAATAVLVVPRREVVLCAGALALFSVRSEFSPPGTMVVTFLDVGQGDAALVEHSDGRRWLIDGGPPGTAVLHYLRRRGIRRLDRVIASHAHPDHVGGLGPVLRELRVDAVWVPPGDDARDWAAVEAPGVPAEIPEERLHPDAAFSGSANDRSLVLPIAHRGVRFLFPGDVEAAAERRLASEIFGVDVLKVPHHGSRTSSTAAWLDATRPRWAVVSAGRDNRFGHPHPEVVERYAARAVDLLRTDVNGTMRFSVGSTAELCTHRAGVGWSGRRTLLGAADLFEDDLLPVRLHL